MQSASATRYMKSPMAATREVSEYASSAFLPTLLLHDILQVLQLLVQLVVLVFFPAPLARRTRAATISNVFSSSRDAASIAVLILFLQRARMKMIMRGGLGEVSM